MKKIVEHVKNIYDSFPSIDLGPSRSEPQFNIGFEAGRRQERDFIRRILERSGVIELRSILHEDLEPLEPQDRDGVL